MNNEIINTELKEEIKIIADFMNYKSCYDCKHTVTKGGPKTHHEYYDCDYTEFWDNDPCDNFAIDKEISFSLEYLLTEVAQKIHTDRKINIKLYKFNGKQWGATAERHIKTFQDVKKNQINVHFYCLKPEDVLIKICAHVILIKDNIAPERL